MPWVIHSTEGVIVFNVAQKGMKYLFYYPTQSNKKCDADAHTCTVRLGRKTMADGLFKLPITLLIVVRNIKCGFCLFVCFI